MAKKIMTSAKELAYKAYMDGMQKAVPVKINPDEIMEGFENWWSDNYGNRDTTKFLPRYDIFVEGRRYICAE